MSKLKTTVLCISVHREDESPIFGENSTHIVLEDEAGGPFIILKQSNNDNLAGETRLDIDELELITKVAREMFDQIQEED